MCRPYACEECFIIKGGWVFSVLDRTNGYQNAITSHGFPIQRFVYVRLAAQTNEFLEIHGLVRRSGWKKIVKQNLPYEINGKVYHIRDIINNVQYVSSEIDPQLYDNVIRFDQMIPKRQ